MTNIWELFLYATSVTATALILLLIKNILSDKLSARWQYSVWGVLLLRWIIPPVSAYSVIHPVPLFLETIKGNVESSLSSAYTDVYKSIAPKSFFPIIKDLPESITDILFLAYVTGIILFLLWYLISYIRLRNALNSSEEVSAAVRDKIQRVSEKYSLPSCKTVFVSGIDTAFISGLFRPILAIPSGKDIDEKIILHEMMHLKHYDTAHNILLSIFKAFNWYNPVMWYVANEISNDMETLCDRRVLEVLEGEERRQYGNILLQMVNEKYSGNIGTTGTANGGKNIKKRIASIVRFKKYPKGMAVVSVCIIFILTFSLMTGYAQSYSLNDYSPYENFHKALAIARTNRCNTIAGAIDMYAKAVLQSNITMLGCVTPLEGHENIGNIIHSNPSGEKYRFDTGRELAFLNVSEGYRIYNLINTSSDTYEATLLFHTNGLYDGEKDSMLMAEDGTPYGHCGVSLKIRIYYSDGWCVEEIGERRIETHYLNLYQPPFELIDTTKDMKAKSDYGTVRIRHYTQYEISNTVQNQNVFWNSSSFEMNPKPNALFSYVSDHFYCEYDSNTRTVPESPEMTYGIQLLPVDSADEEVKWPDTSMLSPVSGVSSDGFNWAVDNVRPWDEDMHESVKEYYGIVQTGSSTSIPFDSFTGEVKHQDMYRVRIFWDGWPVDELVITEGEK